jgi:hypothetical protein
MIMSSENDSNISQKAAHNCLLEFIFKQPKYNVCMRSFHCLWNLTALRAVSKLSLIEATNYF